MTYLIIVFLFVLAFILVLLFSFFYTIFTSIQLALRGKKTIGYVSECEEIDISTPRQRRRGVQSLQYQPILTFKDETGKEQKASGIFNKSKKRRVVGEEYPIVYLPYKPSVARIDTFSEKWLSAGYILFMAVFLTGIEYFVLLKMHELQISSFTDWLF